MSFQDPKEMTAAGLEKGVAKAKLSLDKAIVAASWPAPTSRSGRSSRR
jgi:hypothetical protein